VAQGRHQTASTKAYHDTATNSFKFGSGVGHTNLAQVKIMNHSILNLVKVWGFYCDSKVKIISCKTLGRVSIYHHRMESNVSECSTSCGWKWNQKSQSHLILDSGFPLSWRRPRSCWEWFTIDSVQHNWYLLTGENAIILTIANIPLRLKVN
jgi:hypothetical protein